MDDLQCPDANYDQTAKAFEFCRHLMATDNLLTIITRRVYIRTSVALKRLHRKHSLP